MSYSIMKLIIKRKRNKEKESKGNLYFLLSNKEVKLKKYI